ncbi:homocysteine S-methyltransferase family protein [Paludisphaera rhizosphaerae]|uniref:homocysteine S-methyltransferase family protein n=1 Tax=Paludisphaera rhizosphaerae TaxID=2711216 RepID=UPI0013EB8743|nr:homocysteine S-methyltransferase family protein [Paludisphaera rhizosphaerae]
MNRLHALIGEPPFILDGAQGTELQKRGLPIGESSDVWNLSRPDVVLAVAQSYVESGSQGVLTNTFQANPIALRRSGLESETRRINEAGAGIACDAAAGRARVFGSIGPVGAATSEAADGFAVQAQALALGGVDAIVLETCLSLAEARLAASAALETGLPVVASFHFHRVDGELRAFDGTSPEDVAQAMVEAGVDGVGANCGEGPGDFTEICQRLASACHLPIWLKPNAGLPTIDAGRAVYSTSPEALADRLSEWLEAGAWCVGGCCGTTPKHIAALRRRADSLGHFLSQ